MKQLIQLFFKGEWNKLIFEPTNDIWAQFFRSLFVGGMAFLVDAFSLFVIEKMGAHYLVATAFGFLFGLLFNFWLSKRVVFAKAKPKIRGLGEFSVFALVGIIGLALTEILMYVFTDIVGFYFMLSKIVAAGIVLFWNFGARKILLYS